MNEESRKQIDKQLFEKLITAKSTVILSVEEAKRLAQIFANYQKKYPLVYGSGSIKKSSRNWII